MSTFDVWITGFRPDAQAPARGLQRVFGVDETTAKLIVGTVPRMVKQHVHAKVAGEVRAALESIGAVVDCRPSARVRRASEPVMRGAVAHFKSAPPSAMSAAPARVSAIDMYSIPPQAPMPQLALEQIAPPVARTPKKAPQPKPLTQPPPPNARQSKLPDALMETAKEQSFRRDVQTAVGTTVIGLGMLIGTSMTGRSIFDGRADIVWTLFQAVGLFLIGHGLFEGTALWLRRRGS